MILSLGLVVAFVTIAELSSPSIPGVAGALFKRNVEADIEATALIYTESTDVRDYLDEVDGKYR